MIMHVSMLAGVPMNARCEKMSVHWYISQCPCFWILPYAVTFSCKRCSIDKQSLCRHYLLDTNIKGREPFILYCSYFLYGFSRSNRW